MTNPRNAVKVEHYKAFGVTPTEQLESFRQLLQTHPERDWTRAEVDRHAGLTLFRERAGSGKVLAVRFSTALCGYEGTGPRAAVQMLLEAGFDTKECIEERIFRKTSCLFHK